jgi:hypothetical protein
MDLITTSAQRAVSAEHTLASTKCFTPFPTSGRLRRLSFKPGGFSLI